VWAFSALIDCERRLSLVDSRHSVARAFESKAGVPQRACLAAAVIDLVRDHELLIVVFDRPSRFPQVSVHIVGVSQDSSLTATADLAPTHSTAIARYRCDRGHQGSDSSHSAIASSSGVIGNILSHTTKIPAIIVALMSCE
jgi:hypothetical protein